MRPLASLAVLVFALPAAAQTSDLHRSGIPRAEARRLQALIDHPSTHRYEGDAAIRRGARIEGDVFARRGVLTVAGTIVGDLVIVDGDVSFEPGAEVLGDVTVVGGTVRGGDGARLAGTVTEYGEGFGLLARASRLHDRPRDTRSGWDERRWRADVGHADLAVRVADNYNRVEGLPIQFGPDLSTGGPFSTRIEALAVWRTAAGPVTNTRRMGYVARVEQFLGSPRLRVGASVRNTVDPIESWSITGLEASLAAALFHDDQRDYFGREGWGAFVRFAPDPALDVVVEFRDERHRSVAPRDPWTLFDRDDPWREQPLVGEGRIRLAGASIEWDGRRGRDFAPRGWFARAEWLHGLSGSLEAPATTMPLSPSFASGFTTGRIDVRRYQPIGFHGSLGLRAVAGGAFDDRTLAPQFQQALGGAGTLPGYALLGVDCGARDRTVLLTAGAASVPFFPSYGCDRFAMFQAEYRGGLDLHFGGDDSDEDRPWHFDADVDWTVFFDAARGWALGDAVGRADTRTLYDAGAGIILGGFGVYGAIPLTGQDRGLRLFVRLGPRF